MGYQFSDVYKAINNPALIRGEFRKYAIKFNEWYHEKYTDLEGTDVMGEDWDNLIILDGCRYDTFAEINSIEGTLESRISQGSDSSEFLLANFAEREFHNTVYVTANPFEYRLSNDTFHAVVNLLDDWDEELQTVHPSTVTSAAKRVIHKYPKKRYIFHYMQPHYPFIGDAGQEIDHRGYKRDQENPKLDEPNIWDVLQWGYKHYSVTEEQVWEAYRENLEFVLDYVLDLLKIIDGKSVITADHGNLIGDKVGPIPVRGYGHRPDLLSSALVKVPWHIIESESRRQVQFDPPIESVNHDKSDVEERLSALGYKS